MVGQALVAPAKWSIAAIAAVTRWATRRWTVLFAIGLLLAAIMAARSRIGGDQLNLLARGWLLAARGAWVPYGNRTSAGGFSPGGLTAIVVGAPLLVWSDYRAPAVFIVVLSTVGYLLLDRVLPRTPRSELRIAFAIAYWLNPWQLFFSTHLLNPNFLLFFGAVHLATAHRLREQARFGPSLLHGAGLTLSFQLHPSAVMLAIGSALLLWRRRIALSSAGMACGVALGLITFVPYVVHALHDPSVVPGAGGFLGRGAVLILPLIRGVLFWLRYASFAFGRKMLHFDFSPIVGGAARPLELVMAALQHITDPLSVIVAFIANAWVVARLRRNTPMRPRHTLPWLRSYCAIMFAAMLISVGLSPTTVMSWQCIPIFHAAVLPLALFTAVLLRTRWRTVTDRMMRMWLALSLLFAVAIAFGAPIYRLDGREPEAAPLHEHPMLHDLGLASQSDAVLGTETGASSEVLSYP